MPIQELPDLPTTEPPDVPDLDERRYQLPRFGTPPPPDPATLPLSDEALRYIQQDMSSEDITRIFGAPPEEPTVLSRRDEALQESINQIYENPDWDPDVDGSWLQLEMEHPGALDLIQLSSSGLSLYGSGGWAGHLPPGIGEEEAIAILSGEYSEGYPLSAWDFLYPWDDSGAGAGAGGDGDGGGRRGGGGGGGVRSIGAAPRYSGIGLVMWRIK